MHVLLYIAKSKKCAVTRLFRTMNYTRPQTTAYPPDRHLANYKPARFAKRIRICMQFKKGECVGPKSQVHDTFYDVYHYNTHPLVVRENAGDSRSKVTCFTDEIIVWALSELRHSGVVSRGALFSPLFPSLCS